MMIAWSATSPTAHHHMRSSLAAIATAALVTACSSKEGSQSAGASGAAGGTMIYAAPADAMDVFPPYVSDLVGHIVQDLVYERLAEIGPDLQTVGDKGFTPLLAKSWTWAPDSAQVLRPERAPPVLRP